jgi:branched-chain amino acid transport system ATP-binding protein
MTEATIHSASVAGANLSSPMQTILSVDHVEAGYGTLRILRDISFTVGQGEIVTLIGSNGAGKTTVLNTICGIVRARSGSIRFGQQDITRLPTPEIAGLGIAQVPEGRKLFTEMTVTENLEMGAFLRSNRSRIRADINRMYELFPILRERRSTRAGSLSGGEQQMCAIARGLMARPRILLLDEPSLGLSPILVSQIFGIIRDINQEGTTVLLVEQNAHMALSIAHRGYVLSTGEVTLTGSGPELLGNEMVKKLYLGEV